jgi:hypothetical protein
MTDRNQCLLVNIYYGDAVSKFDKLLTDMRQSYIKESFHSFVHGQCYKFIIINYKEREAISSFLLNKENVFTHKTIRLTDEQVNFLIELFLK